jgi:hypothetical protein
VSGWATSHPCRWCLWTSWRASTVSAVSGSGQTGGRHSSTGPGGG